MHLAFSELLLWSVHMFLEEFLHPSTIGGKGQILSNSDSSIACVMLPGV